MLFRSSNKTIEVTFNCNGGSGGGKQTFTSNVSGQKFNIKCNPIQCKVQDGWKRDKNGTAKNYETNSGVTENFVLTYSPKLTLYAHWKVQSIKCNAGYYLKKGATTCTRCESGYYCPGNTYSCSTSAEQGRTKCPNCYTNSPAGSTKQSDCYSKVSKNNYVRTAKSCSVACPSGTYKDAHNVNYGKISSCSNKSIEVTFNCNGGTGGGSQTFTSNGTGQKFSKTCSRTCYTNAGWKRDKNSSTINYSVNSNVTENFVLTYSPKLTIYAHWNQQSTKCSAGYYLKKGATTCTKCEAGYYCPGNTYNCSTTADQGRNACPNGYGNSAAGSSKNTNCYKSVSANYYIKTAKDVNATKCDLGYESSAHSVYYGGTSSCTFKHPYVNNAGKVFDRLDNAIKDSTTTSKVLLTKNGDYSDPSDKLIINVNKTVTLDFKGRKVTLTTDSFRLKGGTIKFVSGELVTASHKRSAVLQTGGAFVLDGGKITSPFKTSVEEGTEAVNVKGGKFTLKSGTITSGAGDKSGYARGVLVEDNGVFNMTGGKIYVNATKAGKWGGCGISMYGGTSTVTGGVVQVVKGGPSRCLLCVNDGGKLNVKYTKANEPKLIWGGVVRNGGRVFWANGSGKVNNKTRKSLLCVEKKVSRDITLKGTSEYGGNGTISLKASSC